MKGSGLNTSDDLNLQDVPVAWMSLDSLTSTKHGSGG